MRASALWIARLALALTAAPIHTTAQAQTAERVAETDSMDTRPVQDDIALRATIERHLRRPYVWGATGLKSFDCSGFVWRVMAERGILIKRTTARKFYMSLPKLPEARRWEFGNIVFFSDLKHCGIVDTRDGFYHAARSAGTHRARFDPFWRGKISGVRAMPPAPAAAGMQD